ncbi:MAG: hypothetical protein H7834_06195 [Magnetococcus sp. YQC-9]
MNLSPVQTAPARSPDRRHAELVPIRSMDLEAVCQFLHERLNQTISPAAWKNAYAQSWLEAPINHGCMLVDEDRVVGAFMALHSEQTVQGRQERFCNLGNWVVLEGYRRQSLSLMRTLLNQPDTHFTLLAANQTVARILATQGFTPLSGQVAILSTVRWPSRMASRVIEERSELLSVLPPEAARDCRHHRPFPWLRQLAIGDRNGFCHLIYKPGKQGRFTHANVLHLNDPVLFATHFPALSRHLLMRHGITSVQVPHHLLPVAPPGARTVVDPKPGLFRSDRLSEQDLSYLYTEIMTLDRSACDPPHSAPEPTTNQ